MRHPARVPLSNQPAIQSEALPKQSSGWDIGIAAFALAVMTAGFWRLWPGAVMLNEAPLGAVILKAGLAALGFVAIATRWEDTLRAYATNPTALVLLVLACLSPLWALNFGDSMRDAILLVAIWGFGIALALRFNPRELAEICAFAGLFGVAAQFLAHRTLPPSQALDGDLAFAVLATAWAAWIVPERRLVWLLVLACCAALVTVVEDWGAIGAGLGLILGLGLAKAGAVARRGGAISIIVTAWVIVACIVAVTLFALFGAQPVTAHIADFFRALGSQGVLGQGFGQGGASVAGAFGAGLGIVGAFTLILVLFATLFQALLGRSSLTAQSQALTAVWFAALGAIIVSPHEVAALGPISIVFVAASFSIALACAPGRPHRIPLMARNRAYLEPKVFPRPRPAPPLRDAASGPSQTNNPLSLRPKI